MPSIRTIALVAGALIATTGSARADCVLLANLYKTDQTIENARPYIGCLEGMLSGAATQSDTVTTLPSVAEGPGLPVVGTIPVPSNPSFDQLQDLLQTIKAQGQVSDYTWSTLMSSTLKDSGSVTVVFNKDKIDPAYKEVEPFTLAPTSPVNLSKTTQIFVDPAQLRGIESYTLGLPR